MEADGCVTLELPLTTLDACHQLTQDQQLQLKALTHRAGGDLFEEVVISVKKLQDSVSFQLQASAMGSNLKKCVRDVWSCVITGCQFASLTEAAPAETDPPTNVCSGPGMCLTDDGSGPGMCLTDDGSGPGMCLTDDGSGPGMCLTDDGSGPGMCLTDDGSGPSMCLTDDGSGPGMCLTDDGSGPGMCLTDDGSGEQEAAMLSGGSGEQEAAMLSGGSGEQEAAMLSGGSGEQEAAMLSGGSGEQDAAMLSSLNNEAQISQSNLVNMTKDDKPRNIQMSCRFCHKNFDHSKNPLQAVTSHEVRWCRGNPKSIACRKASNVCSDNLPYTCNMCPQSFKHKQGLSIHHGRCHRNHEESLLDCRFCGKEFKNRTNCLNHERYKCECNPDHVTCHICSRCARRFAAQKDLDEHISMTHKQPKHQMSEEYPFGCPQCTEAFKASTGLAIHMTRAHREVKGQSLECRFCKKIFKPKQRSNRSYHENYRCTMNPNVHAVCACCPRCNRRFPSHQQMEQHVMTRHSGDRVTICELCGSTFTNRSSLYNHKNSVHEMRGADFFCSQCDRSFPYSHMLEKHMIKHSTERNYQCAVCGKRFKDQSQEMRHRSRLHENKYPYHCHKCGHGVGKKIYLEKHVCGRIRRQQADASSSEILQAVSNTKQDNEDVLSTEQSGMGLIQKAASISEVLQSAASTLTQPTAASTLTQPTAASTLTQPTAASTPTQPTAASTLSQPTSAVEFPQSSFVILPTSSSFEAPAVLSMSEVETKLLGGVLENSISQPVMDENERSYYYMQNPLSMYPYSTVIEQDIVQHYNY